MAKKSCPHCGDVVSKETKSCGCGYKFTGAEPLGAGVARETSARLLQDKPSRSRAEAPPEKRSRKKEGRKKGSGSGSSSRARPAAAARPETSPPKAAEQQKAAKPEVSMSNSSKLMECPSCPALISKRAERCPKCGNSPYAKCQICSNQIAANCTSCPECGDPDPFNG
jgi:hypothetical protein